METLKKVTVMLPADLLHRATTATVALSHSYASLRRLRGKVKFSMTAAELRHS
jgi:hypothetical protein